jgi:hypothetical protein
VGSVCLHLRLEGRDQFLLPARRHRIVVAQVHGVAAFAAGERIVADTTEQAVKAPVAMKGVVTVLAEEEVAVVLRIKVYVLNVRIPMRGPGGDRLLQYERYSWTGKFGAKATF